MEKRYEKSETRCENIVLQLPQLFLVGSQQQKEKKGGKTLQENFTKLFTRFFHSSSHFATYEVFTKRTHC